MQDPEGKCPADIRDDAGDGASDAASGSPRPLSGAKVRFGIAFLCALIAIASCYAWIVLHRESKETSTMKTLPVLLTLLYLMDDQLDPALDFSESDTWEKFSPSQYDAVLAASSEYGDPYIGQSAWTDDGTFVDPWGRPYRIAAQKKNNYREFIVWSLGEDGVARTPDDIVRPYEASIP